MASIVEGIRARADGMTPAERKVARALLARFPVLGLSTVAEFAESAGVSPPTILRFTARLGFSSYAEFQRRLREELEAQIETPLAKHGLAGGRPAGGPPHMAFAEAACANVAATFDSLPPTEFRAIVDLLADARRPIHLIGGRFTDPLARYMAAHLRILRPAVSHVEGQPGNWRDHLMGFGRRDILVVFDVRRYQDDLVGLAEAAARLGATIVLLTDQWLSPVARIAAHVLPARIAAPSVWDSNAALLVLVEAIVAAVTEADPERSRARIEAREQLRD
ncbi:MurR/RpiR family transcriptional regulator [Propylenella binzhouense]|uniref:MurR/RpiR family transcriptional regulator n=1 Tax=Propylenella binzhouense TaxID=2555902 RepID=A0A964T5E3_9HYPH|nr:MurR/RpiR family transcriptional regulator [Propylenella binzhouense]MYZ48212.1 MurR/RpiR family transcriptional regulator [Propylenella binzhouense]